MNWFLLCLIKLQDNFDDDGVLKLLLSIQCPGVPVFRMMSAWPDMKMGSKPGLQVSCDWSVLVT